MYFVIYKAIDNDGHLNLFSDLHMCRNVSYVILSDMSTHKTHTRFKKDTNIKVHDI